jgi:hypothetical protein
MGWAGGFWWPSPRTLNERAWPVPTAEQFAVFATDLELTQTTNNLKGAVPRRTSQLQAQRWLRGLG